MREKTGRDMHYSSEECLRIWQGLNKNEKDFEKDFELCDKCNGKGYLVDHVLDSVLDCEKCQTYGFYLKEIK
jgi:hypothetical protein